MHFGLRRLGAFRIVSDTLVTIILNRFILSNRLNLTEKLLKITIIKELQPEEEIREKNTGIQKLFYRERTNKPS